MTLKNPLQLQFPFALWTRAMIRPLIQRKYGIKLSVDLGRQAVGANGVDLPKAAEPGLRAGCDLGEAMGGTRFPEAPGLGEEGARRRCFSAMRAECDRPFTLERHGAYAEKPLSFATPANGFISICCLRSRVTGANFRALCRRGRWPRSFGCAEIGGTRASRRTRSTSASTIRRRPEICPGYRSRPRENFGS